MNENHKNNLEENKIDIINNHLIDNSNEILANMLYERDIAYSQLQKIHNITLNKIQNLEIQLSINGNDNENNEDKINFKIKNINNNNPKSFLQSHSSIGIYKTYLYNDFNYILY